MEWTERIRRISFSITHKLPMRSILHTFLDVRFVCSCNTSISFFPISFQFNGMVFFFFFTKSSCVLVLLNTPSAACLNLDGTKHISTEGGVNNGWMDGWGMGFGNGLVVYGVDCYFDF